MNIKEAALCLDCEEIYVRKNHNYGCPACGGRQSAPVVRFLKSVEGDKNDGRSQTVDNMSTNTKDKPIATLTVKGACDLHPKTRKAFVDWLREQAQILELQSNELAKTYSARFFWRSK